MKICKECKKEKKLTDFYKHRYNIDGLNKKCKKCVNLYLQNYRLKNHDHVLKLERKRYDTEKARIMKKKHRELNPKKTEARRIAYKERYNQKQNEYYHRDNPDAKYHNKNNKKLKIHLCIICNKKAEAHHDDYSKPLKIIWLCRKHHLKKHGYLKEVS